MTQTPEYLRTTYQLLRCAFPNNIADDEYEAVIYFFHPYMSFRTLATVLAIITNRTYIHILNDVMGYNGKLPADTKILQEVHNRLNNCGYPQWIKSE